MLRQHAQSIIDCIALPGFDSAAQEKGQPPEREPPTWFTFDRRQMIPFFFRDV